MNTLSRRLAGLLWGLASLVCAAPLAPIERLGVSDTLLGILSYTRWPHESGPLRLCVAGHGVHAERLLKEGLSGLAQRPIEVQRLGDGLDMAQCDALYLATVAEAVWRQIAVKVLGTPVLTVCERSIACAAAGMVSLAIDSSNNVQFEVNLDAVARSGVRLNPQVLKLGRRAAKSDL